MAESDRDEYKSAAQDAAVAQIERLAAFIMREIPGEPSQSEGAVDTAIRWMRSRLIAESHETIAAALGRSQTKTAEEHEADAKRYVDKLETMMVSALRLTSEHATAIFATRAELVRDFKQLLRDAYTRGREDGSKDARDQLRAWLDKRQPF